MAKKKLTKEEKAAAKAEKKALKKAAKAENKATGFFKDFVKFLSRGNILDLAVGVIIGSAFSAVVTAFSNILLSLCTWWVPGGISGLVTVLPAANSAQAGLDGVGQTFTDIAAVAESSGVDQATLLANYTLHGDTYVYNSAAIIDWGTFINAIISFIVVGFTLFVIVRTTRYLSAKRKILEEKAKEKYYEEHPEERPEEPKPEEPKPTTEELLTLILAELKTANGTAEKAEAPVEEPAEAPEEEAK